MTDKHLEHSGNYSALRDAVVAFFATEGAEWEIRAQLAVNLTDTPIEDASFKWPKEKSPYFPVGRLIAEPQQAYSAARRIFVDEHLSFNPWYGLAAHQPLGNVNRARKMAYQNVPLYRQAQEGRQRRGAKEISESPD